MLFKNVRKEWKLKMRDVVKNDYQTRQAPQSPRRRRRKRNLSLYYLMIFILVTVVGITLSMTVFFKITKINVIGNTQYDTKSIIECSKIKIGDNLFRADYDKATERILKGMIYIDDVKVKKSFPNGVTIEVKPSVPYANVVCKDKYLLISKTGKILEEVQTPQQDLLIFKGYDPTITDVGAKIKCEDSSKDKLMSTICDELSKLEITKINEIDIADSYNIKMLYENRINIELGSQSDLDYKMNFAKELLENKIAKNKQGTIFMRGDNGFGFIEKSDLDLYEKNFESATVTQETSVNTSKVGTAITSAVTKNTKKTSPSE